MIEKEYLGDSVYAKWDSVNKQLVLTTENGIQVIDTIYLEPEVIEKLLDYIKRVKES